MNKTLILISAFFVFLYSNTEELDKKIINNNQDEISLKSKNKTMITFNTFFKIHSGWNMVGMAHDIENVKEFLSKDCILHAKKYQDDAWQEYNALDGTNNIEKINSHDALFIYSSGDCELNNYGTRIFESDEIKIQPILIDDNNLSDTTENGDGDIETLTPAIIDIPSTDENTETNTTQETSENNNTGESNTDTDEVSSNEDDKTQTNDINENTNEDTNTSNKES